jgi:hypothetical protein
MVGFSAGYPGIDEASGFRGGLKGLLPVYPSAVLPYVHEFVMNAAGGIFIEKVSFAVDPAVRATETDLVEVAASAGGQHCVGEIMLAGGVPDFPGGLLRTRITDMADVGYAIMVAEMADNVWDVQDVTYIAAAAADKYTYSGFTKGYFRPWNDRFRLRYFCLLNDFKTVIAIRAVLL